MSDVKIQARYRASDSIVYKQDSCHVFVYKVFVEYKILYLRLNEMRQALATI